MKYAELISVRFKAIFLLYVCIDIVYFLINKTIFNRRIKKYIYVIKLSTRILLR